MSKFTTLARPYARAAFETALETGRLNEWSTMLGLLATVSQVENVARYLGTPSLHADQQAQALIDLCAEELDNEMGNFVKVLAGKKRLPLLPDIAELFNELKAERERAIDVDVISAFELGDAARQKLQDALKERLQREIKLVTSIDKSLIGGVVIRAGDMVIDGSVRGKLNKLVETMIA